MIGATGIHILQACIGPKLDSEFPSHPDDNYTEADRLHEANTPFASLYLLQFAGCCLKVMWVLGHSPLLKPSSADQGAKIVALGALCIPAWPHSIAASVFNKGKVGLAT